MPFAPVSPTAACYSDNAAGFALQRLVNLKPVQGRRSERNTIEAEATTMGSPESDNVFSGSIPKL